MATESTLAANLLTTTHASQFGKSRAPYMVEYYIDFAAWTTAKGSALAAADILEVATVPNQTALLYGGIEVITVTDAGTGDLTVDWGYGGDDDYFVVAMDCDGGTAAGSVSSAAATSFDGAGITAAKDTLDIVIAGTSVDVTTGVIRVWALLMDVSKMSDDRNVADRDLLA